MSCLEMVGLIQVTQTLSFSTPPSIRNRCPWLFQGDCQPIECVACGKSGQRGPVPTRLQDTSLTRSGTTTDARRGRTVKWGTALLLVPLSVLQGLQSCVILVLTFTPSLVHVMRVASKGIVSALAVLLGEERRLSYHYRICVRHDWHHILFNLYTYPFSLKWNN